MREFDIHLGAGGFILGAGGFIQGGFILGSACLSSAQPGNGNAAMQDWRKAFCGGVSPQNGYERFSYCKLACLQAGVEFMVAAGFFRTEWEGRMEIEFEFLVTDMTVPFGHGHHWHEGT